MRILLDYRPALRERTGVGEYVHQLATALVQVQPATDTVTLFSSSRTDRLAADAVPGARVVDAHVPVGVLNFAWHRLEWPSVERFAGEQDIVQSLHPLLMPTRRAAQIVTVHDLDFLDHPERTRAEIRRDYASLAAGHARRAHAVVAVSAFTAGQVQQKLGVAKDRIAICSPGAPAWAARPRPAPTGPILFVGTLERRKNVGLLLDAYARLLERMPNAPRLVLAGRATADAESWLKTIAAAPLAGHVDHLGYVPAVQRYDLYASASMLVLPSHLEGFGLPLLEAMTVGVPAIVSNRGALPEVGGDAATILEPDEPRAWADAMARYLCEPGAADRAAARGLARAREYSWLASARRLREVYSVAIERAARQR